MVQALSEGAASLEAMSAQMLIANMAADGPLPSDPLPVDALPDNGAARISTPGAPQIVVDISTACTVRRSYRAGNSAHRTPRVESIEDLGTAESQQDASPVPAIPPTHKPVLDNMDEVHNLDMEETSQRLKTDEHAEPNFNHQGSHDCKCHDQNVLKTSAVLSNLVGSRRITYWGALFKGSCRDPTCDKEALPASTTCRFPRFLWTKVLQAKWSKTKLGGPELAVKIQRVVGRKSVGFVCARRGDSPVSLVATPYAVPSDVCAAIGRLMLHVGITKVEIPPLTDSKYIVRGPW